MNKIGNKIRLAREERGLSQEKLAFDLGISQPSYARLEKLDSRISITKLIEIAHVFKTTVADLIDEKTQKVINQQGSENPNAYVDSIINADKEHIQTLRNEINFLREMLKEQNK
jgi:transcriptional regulator with XRE-family HTH domain